MDISMTCSMCRHVDTIHDVDREDLKRYREGELVQNVWPLRSAQEREMLISFNNFAPYICSKCWDETFAEED